MLTSADAFILLSLPFHNTEQLLQMGRATIQLEPNSLGQSLQSMLHRFEQNAICCFLSNHHRNVHIQDLFALRLHENSNMTISNFLYMLKKLNRNTTLQN